MRTTSIAILLALSTACATSPTGRKQLMLLPESEMDQMGVQAFDQMKAQTPTDQSPGPNNYVKCIVAPLAQAAKPQTGVTNWEVVVFKDDTPNAFALPGGKIGVHTGMFPVAKTDAQLAAVIGHEIGHVIAKHGNERASEALAAQGGLAVLGASARLPDTVMAALGLGAQVGYILPHSRDQESEADLIGLQLMAKAGFDPRQALELWKNMMAAAGGGSPPEILSDHPVDQKRIDNLQAHMPEALQLYQQAQAEGKHPSCQRNF